MMNVERQSMHVTFLFYILHSTFYIFPDLPL